MSIFAMPDFCRRMRTIRTVLAGRVEASRGIYLREEWEIVPFPPRFVGVDLWPILPFWHFQESVTALSEWGKDTDTPLNTNSRIGWGSASLCPQPSPAPGRESPKTY